MGDPSFVIVAPDEDAEAVEAVLRPLHEDCRRAPIEAVSEEVDRGAVKVLVLAAEALTRLHAGSFRAAVERQPTWSDLPVLLLVDRESARHHAEWLDDLGQVRLVERPLDGFILERAVRAALRSRQRQAGARELMEKCAVAERELRRVGETLEERVRDRTEQLETAYNRLVKEAEERFAAEERLRESEELYRYTVELSQQMAWTADPNKRLTSASRGFSEVTGIPPEVDPHEAWMMAVHPDDIAAVMAAWNSTPALNQPRVAEFRMRVADGSYRLFRARAAPKLDARRQVIRWYGYTEDIHDQRQAELARHQAEERLRESEELYRYTLELSEQIVWSAAPDGTFLGRSRRYLDLTGLSEDTPPLDAIHPDDAPAMEAEWLRCIATGDAFFFEYRLRMKDGSYRYFRSRARPRRDEQGSMVRWYGTSEDIHERKQAHQARLEAEERYQLAARATNDVIWDLNLLSDQIEWGDSASSFFGYAGGGEPTSLAWWEERVHPEDREGVTTSLERALRGKQTHWSESYRFRHADGHYADIYDRGFIIRDGGGRAVRAVGAMSDVTDRKLADAQLQRMQAELIHVSRVSAMGTMASTLAHELNQPLTAVSNYVGGSRRLLQDNQDPVVLKVREALEAAEAGALRAGRIVRGLRELVARGNVSIKSEELPQLVHDAALLAFVDAHLLGISHRIEIDPRATWVDADRIQIQQVLINLIRNSMQALSDQPVREVVIAAAPAGATMVEISVADTGVGLSREVREALFSPFRSTKAEGMGIGLSISRTIVEAHGGKIWAEDRAGGGTIFRFTVPKAEEPGLDDLDPPAAAAAE
jgi:PAS domain S-box-containing protein